MLSMTSIFLNVVVFIRARRNLDLRRIVPLLAAGVAGLPAGVWILKTADQSLLKIAIGGIVAVSSLMFISGFRIKVAREKPAMVPVGLLSGVLSGATTLSGPPVILFFVNQDVPKHQFRASLSAYFLLLNLVAVPAFAAGGLLTRDEVLRTALLFPAVAVGSLIGIFLADRISEGLFRRYALIALALLGILSVISGL